MKLIFTVLLLNTVWAQLDQGLRGKGSKQLSADDDGSGVSLSYSYSYAYSPGPDVQQIPSSQTPSESPSNEPSNESQSPTDLPFEFHQRPQPFIEVCSLQSTFSDPLGQPHGTLRDASSTPAHANVAFDPIAVGWTGQYSRGRVNNHLYPNMTAYISDDQGVSFYEVNSTAFTPGRLLTAARFQDTIIIGGEAFPDKTQVILYSSDGGATFSTSYTGGIGVIYGSCLTNASFGYAVGTLDPARHSSNSTSAHNHTNYVAAPQQGVILFTEDGGASWQDIPVPDQVGLSVNLRGVSCPDDFTVVIVGKVNDTQTIWTSFDSAASFDVQSFSENLLYDVSVLQSGLGYAVGAESERSHQSANILRTFDWGETWEEVFRGAGSLYGVLAFNLREAFVVGVNFAAKAQIYRSFSEGDLWQRYKPSIGFDVLYGVTAGYNSSLSDSVHGRVNEFAEPDRLLVAGNIGTSGDGRSPVLIDTCHFQKETNLPSLAPSTNGTFYEHQFHRLHASAVDSGLTQGSGDDDFSYGDDMSSTDDISSSEATVGALRVLHRRLEHEAEEDAEAEMEMEMVDEDGEFEDLPLLDARSLRIHRGWQQEDADAAEY